MKKSKGVLKIWSKKYDEQYTYGLTVYGSGLIEFWYETPRETIPTVTHVDDFISGNLNHKVDQYLGSNQLEEILTFLKRNFKPDDKPLI